MEMKSTAMAGLMILLLAGTIAALDLGVSGSTGTSGSVSGTTGSITGGASTGASGEGDANLDDQGVNVGAQGTANANGEVHGNSGKHLKIGEGANLGMGAGLGLGVNEGAFRKRLMEREKALRERVKQQFGERMDQLREERKAALEEIRANVTGLEKDLNALRGKKEKGELTADEKVEFKGKAIEHIQASFDERIKIAQRLQLEGVSNVTVDTFVTVATHDKLEFANATDNTERRAIIQDFNAAWRTFVQAAAREFLAIRYNAALAAGHDALDKIDTAIGAMEANATVNASVTAELRAQETDVNARLDATLDAQTVGQAAWRLGYARQGLMELRNHVQAALNGKAVADLTERSEPSGLANGVPIDLKAQAAAAAQATASVSPTPEPTATASVEASASASA